MTIRLLLLLLAVSTGMAEAARFADPLPSPWSPNAHEGSWWGLRLSSPATREEWDVTLVLARVDGAWGLGFVGEPDALAAGLGRHILPLGRLGPQLEHESNGDFQPFRFPAAVGDEWETRLFTYAVHATTTRADASGVRVDYRFLEGGLRSGHAVYDFQMGFFRKFVIDGWGGFKTIEHGSSYASRFQVPWNLDLVFSDGSYPAPDRSRPLVPPIIRRDVTDEHPASALFLIAAGLDGPNLVRVQTPQGREFAAQANPGAIDVAYHVGEDPRGAWNIVSTSNPRAIAYAELVGFTWREPSPVTRAEDVRPDALVPIEENILAPPLLAFGAGTAAFAAWALWRRFPKFLAPLYARIPKERVLEHPMRSRILDWVRANPGVTTQEIRYELGLGWGATVHHLTTLEAHGILASVQWGRNRDWYVVGTLSADERAKHSALKRVRARQLYDIIAARPGIAQQQLADELGLHHSTVGFHLEKLIGVGLVQADRRVHAVRFFVLGPRA